MATAVPTEFGKYRILDLLGEGGMGAVYRAEDTVLLRQVAVKVMTEAIARQAPLRNRFLREARAAGSLQHANIVTVYDFGEVEGHLFIAMELVDGADLEQLLAEQQPTTLSAKLDIIGDVLAGLGYAHRHGVVHRDIKPPNIRITSDGRAKIMDFGIAYVGASDLTGTGLAIGTPSYMAPEQITGGTVTAAADLFALGVVLYELLAGVRPFVGTSVHSILFKIVGEEPPDLTVLIPGVSPALVAVVQRALQKDPAARYQSAQEMAQDLVAARETASRGASEGAAQGAGQGGDGAWTRAVRAGEQAPVDAPSMPAPASTTSDPAITGAAVPASGPNIRAWWIAVAVGACVLGAVALWGTRARTGGVQPSAVAAAQPTAPAPATVAAPPTASSPPAITGAAETSPAVASPAVTSPAAAIAAAPAVTRLPGRGAGGMSTPAAPRTPAAGAPSTSVASTAVPAPGARPTAALPTGATTTPPAAAPTVAASPVERPAGAGTSSPDAAAPPPSAAVTASEIGEAARVYARAIESRDIAAVRRAYPGITDAQERGFRQFFDVARGLHVTFAVSGVDVAGSTADARLTGTYEYSTTDGQRQRQPVDFAATLRHDATGWRFASVR